MPIHLSSIDSRGVWAFLENVVFVGQIGRCDDDVILKLFLLITRRQKEIFSSKQKTFKNRHGACVLRNMIVSLQCRGEAGWVRKSYAQPV